MQCECGRFTTTTCTGLMYQMMVALHASKFSPNLAYDWLQLHDRAETTYSAVVTCPKPARVSKRNSKQEAVALQVREEMQQHKELRSTPMPTPLLRRRLPAVRLGVWQTVALRQPQVPRPLPQRSLPAVSFDINS